MNNARFWHWHSPADQWVKITLKPGQSLSWSQGGPCEEGWFRQSITWEYDIDEGVVICTHDESGADCDGRYDRGFESHCLLDELQSVPGVADWETGEVLGPPRPNWEKGRQYQRDHAAEAMGY